MARASNDRRAWLVAVTLISGAAAHLCVLMVLNVTSQLVAALWNRVLWLTAPVYFLLYVASSQALSLRGKRSGIEKVPLVGSYTISLALVAMTVKFLAQGSIITISGASWNLTKERISTIYLISGLILTALAVGHLVSGRHRGVPANELPLAVRMIVVVTLGGLVGTTPFLSTVAPKSGAIVFLTVLLYIFVILGYGTLRFRQLVTHLLRVDATRFLTNAIVAISYVAVSFITLRYLLSQGISESPLFVALALSSLAIGVGELARHKIAGTWLGRLLSQSDPGYYQTVRVISRALIGQDISRMLRAVLEQICQRLETAEGFIAVHDDQDEQFKIRAVYGMSSIREGENVELTDLAEPVLPLRTEDPLTLLERGMGVLIPLQVGSRHCGTLALGHRPGMRFIDAELQLLTALSHQLSVAVENLWLKQQFREQLDDLAAEGEEVLQRQATMRDSVHIALTGLESVRQQSVGEVRVQCLGTFRVHRGKEVIKDRQWGGRSSGHRHAKAVFAYLAANRERVVRRDELIELIWGDSADIAILENRMDRTVSALRRALEPGLSKGAESSYILSAVGGYRLNPAIQWWIDAEEFNALAKQAREMERSGDEAGALTKYLDAVRLYQGEYMIDCAFVDRSHLIIVEREALKIQYVQALVHIADLYQRNGSPETGIVYLQEAALEDEYNEEVYRLLISSCCRAGRYADAVLVCQTHQSVLAQAGLPCSKRCFPASVQARVEVEMGT